MLDYLIKNAECINEGERFHADLGIKEGRITQLDPEIDKQAKEEIDASGLLLIPGFIDDQVHFREPGLTHKAEILTESKAAAAGGITSFMEMPNTNPQTITTEALEEKFEIASQRSWVNYSFYLGATNDNIEEIKKLDPSKVCGIKIFMGASTGNMLVDKHKALEDIFKHSPTIIATHCEKEEIVRANQEEYLNRFGENIPIEYHPIIRSREACFASSSEAIELAKATGADLHILHLSTEEEMELFDNESDIEKKKITAEACAHHLWFTDEEYATKGSFIKWNPAVKTSRDRSAIRKGVKENRIDILATDHAPHTIEEKGNHYMKCPSGGPLVQDALLAFLEMEKEGVFSLEEIVQKSSHNVAKRFKVKERGFLREGYFADIVLIDRNKSRLVEKSNILYKCGWSPFEGQTFSSSVSKTFVSGRLVYSEGKILDRAGMRLEINR